MTSNHNPATVSILRGNPAGGFAPPLHFVCGLNPNQVVLGDVNLDGNQDILTISDTGNSVALLLSSGGTPRESNNTARGPPAASAGSRSRPRRRPT